MADRNRSFVVALIVVPASLLAMSGLARAATLPSPTSMTPARAVCEMRSILRTRPHRRQYDQFQRQRDDHVGQCPS